MMRTNSLRRFLLIVAVVPTLALVIGCDELDKAASDAPAKPMGTTMVAPGILAPDDTMPKESSTANNQSTPPADTNPQPTTTPSNDSPAPQTTTENDPNLKKPDATDGAKGQGYGGGIITEPVREYFALQYRIMFDQLAHELKTWHALNNRYPKDLEEYKKEIMIPKGYDELPELKPNCEYYYDPKKGELFVRTKPQ